MRPTGILAGLVLGAVLAGCGASATPAIVRRVGGERREGVFVSPYSYEMFVRGELAVARDDLRGAAEAFELARAGPDEDPLVLARLADVLDRLGQREEADEILGTGHALDPRSEAIWLAEGDIAVRRGEREHALEAYERAEAAAPASSTSPIALSRLLRRLSADGRADAVLERFIQRNPERGPAVRRARLELALARGDAVAAAEAVTSLLEIAPAERAEVVRAAELALERGRPGLAARLLAAVPASAGDAGLRVRALVESGRAEEAEAILATAAPEVLGGLVGQSRLFLAAGRPDRAAEIADVAVLTDPGPDAWLAAGLAKLSEGRYVEAAPLLSRVPPGVRGFSEARVALATALASQGLAITAAEVLSAALAADADDELALRRALADLRLERGDVNEAIAALAPARGPRGEAARAALLDGAGRSEEAASLWASIAPDAPGLEERERTRARAERLAAQGRIEQARRLLERWTRRAPEDGVAAQRLAQLGGPVDPTPSRNSGDR